MKKIILVVVLFFVLGCATMETAREWTPLPKDVKIVSPEPGLEKFAHYLGIWEGTWDSGEATTIVIEQITPREVIGIYSWGSGRGQEEGWRRRIGRIEEDSVIFRWNGVTLTFKPKNEKRAFAEFRRKETGLILRAILHKK